MVSNITAYTSTQTGDWDDTATWGGGGFPGSGDTATISNTHVVSVKGAEACNSFTVNNGGILRFDGQADTVEAKLSCVTIGGTSINNGTIDQIGTGTNRATISGLNSLDQHYINGNQPSFGDGSWNIELGIDFNMNISTGGGGCVISGVLDTTGTVTINVNDKVWRVYARNDLTFDNGSIIADGMIVYYYGSGNFSDNRVSQSPNVWDFEVFAGATCTLQTQLTVNQIVLYSILDCNNKDVVCNNSAMYDSMCGVNIDIGGSMTNVATIRLEATYGTGGNFLYDANGNTNFGDVTIACTNGETLIYSIECKKLTVSSTGVDVKLNDGEILIANGNVDINDSFIAVGTSTIKCGGDFDCSGGTFTYNTSTLQFVSGTNDMIMGTNDVYNLIIDAGADVTWNGKIAVTGSTTGTPTNDQIGTTVMTINNDLTINGTFHIFGEGQPIMLRHQYTPGMKTYSGGI